MSSVVESSVLESFVESSARSFSGIDWMGGRVVKK